ncbi:MAG: hypothetical protein ACRDPM_25280 [Solirubrobacteraceae bacterium]
MTTLQRRPQAHRGQHRIAAVMAMEAASLALMSFLHLTGIHAGSSKPSNPSHAGIAEAIICLALVAGATSLRRGSPSARVTAPATIGFAIFGFMIGLYFTVQAGDVIDVAYHAAVLPLLALTLLALLRTPTRSQP